MRDAGFRRDQVAARLGHSDSGELFDRLYDLGDRRKRAGVREAIDRLTPHGIRATLAQRNVTPDLTAGRHGRLTVVGSVLLGGWQ